MEHGLKCLHFFRFIHVRDSQTALNVYFCNIVTLRTIKIVIAYVGYLILSQHSIKQEITSL